MAEIKKIIVELEFNKDIERIFDIDYLKSLLDKKIYDLIENYDLKFHTNLNLNKYFLSIQVKEV